MRRLIVEKRAGTCYTFCGVALVQMYRPYAKLPILYTVDELEYILCHMLRQILHSSFPSRDSSVFNIPQPPIQSSRASSTYTNITPAQYVLLRPMFEHIFPSISTCSIYLLIESRVAISSIVRGIPSSPLPPRINTLIPQSRLDGRSWC